MSNQPDVIEKYLDQVCWELLLLPEDDIAEIRNELREHLQSSIEALVATGIDADTARARAIKKFGKARTVGREIARKSPFTWLWRRDGEGRPTISAVNGTIDAIGSMLFIVYIALTTGVLGFHIAVTLPLWIAPICILVFIVQGYLNGMSSIIRQASEQKFSILRRQAAMVLRSQSSTGLPWWKRVLDLHKISPILRVALPLVDKPRLRSHWYLFAFLGLISTQVVWRDYTHRPKTATPGDGYFMLLCAMWLGQTIGELGCIVYFRYRRRLMTTEGGNGDVESA